LGGTDIVGAIVTDYRAMDTLIEISVFAVAALGVLTLLTRGLRLSNPLSPRSKPEDYKDEFDPETIDDVQDARDISTPFTRFVSRIVFTLGFILAFAHINYGGVAPGDGFTAGAFLGLATALWYIVFGFKTAKERLKLFAPHRLLRVGLLLALINGTLPVVLGGGFLGYVNYGRKLGLEAVLSDFNLKLSSTLFYEIAIFLVVFGGFVMIIEAIAHPKFVERLDDTKAQADVQTNGIGA
jgi:multicomponent K+:H+ antiporter subunit A